MRIRLFRQFGSNNSGSYTIVGSFRDAATARAVTDLLRPMVASQDAWADARDREEAPLREFALAQGLADYADEGRDDDWPEHDPNPTAVVVAGNQVLVHSSYTITMPRLFGAFFYARGGRVDVELNHAHHHTVVVFQLWMPWQWRQQHGTEAANVELRRLRDALLAGPIGQHQHDGVPPAVKEGAWGELHLGVVFADLAAGVAAVNAVVEPSPAELRLTLREAVGDGDPLLELRAGGGS